MKPYFILFFLFLNTTFAASQGQVAEDISALLQAGKLAEAEELTNRYLTQDPTNADAVMMKGNIILNKYLMEERSLLSLSPNFDESVYDASLGSISEQPVVLPDNVADDVTKLWQAALKLDSSREDIYLGLATVYSWSGNRTELLALLPVLKEKATAVGDPHYTFANYARNFKDRGDFEGAMEVYKAVHRLFPEQPGLLSDIAGEYFFAGQMDSARLYIARSLAHKNVDEMSLGNGYFILSLMGDYDGALAAMQRMPGDGHLFYEGLVKFFRNEKKWEKPLEKFLQSNPDTSDYKAVSQMLSDTFKIDLDNYFSLIEHDLGDGFKILMHQKFREMRSFVPYFNTAETYCFHKMYAAAAAAFQLIETDKIPMDAEEEENVHFYYAWTLHQLHEDEAALSRWEKLTASEDFFKQSAAFWFLGKYWFDRGEKLKARDYFSQAAGRASESKFATMCWNYMGED